MKVFTRQEQQDIDAQADAAGDAAKALETAIDAYNKALEEPKAAVEAALAEYNSKLADLRETFEGLKSNAEQYQSERSERWQESQNGQQYQSWIDSMAVDGIDDVDLDMPEDLQLPDSIPDWDDRSFLPANSPDEM
jgi:hypothetical protein